MRPVCDADPLGRGRHGERVMNTTASWAGLHPVSPGVYTELSNIYSKKGCVVGVIIGPRVIEAGLSLRLVLVSPVAVAAGFPSPAQDYFDGRIDLNEHLIKDITSTYIVRVSGDSMEQAGISDGDELIVNRALEPRDGSVVVAVLDGELTIKRLKITKVGVVLQAANPLYPDISVPALADLTIWGVATRCLHHV